MVINSSGKSAICSNKQCPERVVSKIANMMDKLNLKDFGEETFRALGTKSLSELLNYKYDDVKILGPLNAEKFIARINEIKTTPFYDYKLIGSIGFTGIASETWKKVLSVIPLIKIISDDDEVLYNELRTIKGIGDVTARTIVQERHELTDDLNVIMTLPNLVLSYGLEFKGKVIRYSGCRPDVELTAYLESKGHDCRPDAGVTRATDILVVPYVGFTSSKVSKLRPDAKLVDYAAFRADPDMYL